MKKTMVYLEDDQYFLLKKIVASSDKGMAEIIREALAEHLKKKKYSPVDALAFVGIAKGPKDGNVSEKAEDVLKELVQ